MPSHAVLQEVAVEALLQATGLPADLVHHALTPLTHGQGVLEGSCTPGGECGAGAPGGGAGLNPEGVLGLGVQEFVGPARGLGPCVGAGGTGLCEAGA